MKALSMSGFRSGRGVFGRLGVLIAAVGVMTRMADKGSSDPPTPNTLASRFFYSFHISSFN